MMAYMHKNRKAFSLVEMMVAASIVAVLGTIAVSSYTRYLARQMVVKAINATSALRQAVEDYYLLYGYLPGANDLISGPGAPYISGYSTSQSNPVYNSPETDISIIDYWNDTATCSSGQSNCDGTGSSQRRQIEITFTNPTSTASIFLGGKIFILRANLNSGVISWVCRTYDSGDSSLWLDSSLLPTSCVG